jgi:hypothetical protein
MLSDAETARLMKRFVEVGSSDMQCFGEAPEVPVSVIFINQVTRPQKLIDESLPKLLNGYSLLLVVVVEAQLGFSKNFVVFITNTIDVIDCLCNCIVEIALDTIVNCI